MRQAQSSRYIPAASSLLESLEATRATRIARAMFRRADKERARRLHQERLRKEWECRALCNRLTGNPDLYNELTAAALPEEATA